RVVRALAAEISRLATAAVAGLCESRDGQDVCGRLGARQNDHSVGRISFDVGHDQGCMPNIKILDDIKAKFKFLANQLAAESGLADYLLRECPLECQVLLDRLRGQPGSDQGGSLERA